MPVTAKPASQYVGARPDQKAADPSSHKLSLRRNFAWTIAGQAIYAACQWGVLVLIAKLTSAAALGQFALGLAITAPILIFANQGLRDLQATDAHRHFGFRDYLRYRLFSVAAALLLIVVLTWLFSYPAVVIIVGISKALESIVDLIHGRYQQHERMDWMAMSFILRGVLTVAAAAVLLVATKSVTWGATGLIVANAGVLALYDWRPKWLFSGETSDPVIARSRDHATRAAWFRSIGRLAMIGLPLGLAHMLNSFSVNVPRYILERHAGEASLGIFAAIMYLLVAGRTVIAALAQSCVARLARYHADRDRKSFNSLLAKQVLLAAAFGAAEILFSIMWGEPFLRLIYKPEYAVYTSVLVLGMVTSALNHLADVTGTALTAVRSVRIQPAILATCVAVGWTVSSLLIPDLGLAGAAWAVLVIGACQLGLYICALTYALIRGKQPHPTVIPEPV